MPEGQIPSTDRVLTGRAAIWLTCPDCDHTTRVLAAMAGRVLRERRHCPKCLSAQAPHMSQTVSGAHIPASEAHHAPSNEEEEAYLHAWIKREGNKQQPRHWFRTLLLWLAPRFSRTRPLHPRAQTVPAADEVGLDLKPAKDDLS